MITERSKTVDGFLSPEGGSDITDKELDILAATYASCRKKGGGKESKADKEKCSKISWGAVNRYRDKKGEKMYKSRWGLITEEDTNEDKSKKVINDLINTSWSGSNEEQMKAIQLLKGLALSDSPEANAFMKKIDDFTSSLKE